MAHRVVEIPWTPHSRMTWATFTTSRKAAAVLWNAMVVRHARIRRLQWMKWPSFGRWCKWAKGRCLGLSAQSVQQLVGEFCEAIDATTKARKAQRLDGADVTAKYPWKTRAQYRDVTYTNQCATVGDGWLCLTHRRGCPKMRIQIPKGVVLPGRLIEVRLAFGVVRVVCDVPAAASAEPTVTTGVDLGVNTLISAGDGDTAVSVSGRGAKAIVQYRNKMLASAESRLSKYKKGSRRHKKLQRRKYKHLDKCKRKIRDLCHKATRIVADAFPNAKVIVGRAFHDAAKKIGRRQAQQVSSACTGRITRQLSYKISEAVKVNEAYSSQQCPWCERRQKCRRVYRCQNPLCGLVAPRDVVGHVNIRAIGLYGRLMPAQKMPTVVRFVRPLRKYPATVKVAGSSGGTPARAAA